MQNGQKTEFNGEKIRVSWEKSSFELEIEFPSNRTKKPCMVCNIRVVEVTLSLIKQWFRLLQQIRSYYCFQEFKSSLFSCPFDHGFLSLQFTYKMMKKVQNYSTILKAIFKAKPTRKCWAWHHTGLFLSLHLKLVEWQVNYTIIRFGGISFLVDKGCS